MSVPSTAEPGSGGIRRVVLIGFMCSGKTTVGATLARRLGWKHIDLDREIERRAGRTVAEIFRTDGEASFRALEAALTAEIAGKDRVVLSPGGGWVTQPGLLALVQPATITVWLQVSPEGVLRRMDPVRQERPLLDTPHPLAEIRRLMAAREPLYRRAGLAIPTEGRDAKSIAIQIESLVRSGFAPPPE